MEKKQLLKKMVKSKAKPATQKAPAELRKVMPLPNKDKKMPILKQKIQKSKEPSWMKKDYQPGSIMRGYTKYA